MTISSPAGAQFRRDFVLRSDRKAGTPLDMAAEFQKSTTYDIGMCPAARLGDGCPTRFRGFLHRPHCFKHRSQAPRKPTTARCLVEPYLHIPERHARLSRVRTRKALVARPTRKPRPAVRPPLPSKADWADDDRGFRAHARPGAEVQASDARAPCRRVQKKNGQQLSLPPVRQAHRRGGAARCDSKTVSRCSASPAAASCRGTTSCA